MKPPEKLLTDLYWSFCEPLPGDTALMLEVLRAYHESIGRTVDARSLQRRLPMSCLDILFKYSQRSAAGEWQEIASVVQIRRATAPALVELLFELHFVLADRLADQDHHFFEGLWLCEQQGADGFPVYELLLGS